MAPEAAVRSDGISVTSTGASFAAFMIDHASAIAVAHRRATGFLARSISLPTRPRSASRLGAPARLTTATTRRRAASTPGAAPDDASDHQVATAPAGATEERPASRRGRATMGCFGHRLVNRRSQERRHVRLIRGRHRDSPGAHQSSWRQRRARPPACEASPMPPSARSGPDAASCQRALRRADVAALTSMRERYLRSSTVRASLTRQIRCREHDARGTRRGCARLRVRRGRLSDALRVPVAILFEAADAPRASRRLWLSRKIPRLAQRSSVTAGWDRAWLPAIRRWGRRLAAGRRPGSA